MNRKKSKNHSFSVKPFNQLKKQLQHHAAPAQPATRSTAGSSTPETEEELFQSAMNGVHVIDAFRTLPCSNPPQKGIPAREPLDTDADAMRILEEISQGHTPLIISATQEYVEWTNPRFSGEIAERLHAGRYAIQALLDLHGCSAAKVNEQVDGFLDNAVREGWRCLKIIHGRGLRSLGEPVVKDAVVRRLAGRYRHRVIAFVSARQCDGGLGALYILLTES